MKKYFEILKKCKLFSNIADENLSAMLDCLNVRVQSFRKNQTIIAEGQKASHIGVMLSGTAQIIRIDYYGNRSILAHIQPSQLFGESFVCADIQSFPVNVIAMEDCEVMLIDGSRILHSCCNACEFHNRMIFNLMKVVATKNIVFNQKIEVTSKRTTREKLMTYLLLQAKEHGSDSFTIPFDRQELADFLEVDRSGLSAEISKLRSEGVLECHKNMFRLIQTL